MTKLSERHTLKMIRQQTVLAKFGELALKSNNLDEILTEACRLVGEALGTDLAKVMELQHDGQTLLVRAGVGWKPGVVGRTLVATNDTSEGHALKTGEPTISANIEEETRFQYPSFLNENGVKALANVLIIGLEGKPPFGMLQIDSRTPRAFNDEDTSFLRSYANLLAAAVNRLLVIGELEATVAGRTSQLLKANMELHAEAAERERVEEALRQSTKMEAVGQLTGGLAHDFNNLLGSISGSLELIRTRMAQGRPGEVERYIEAAIVSGNRAASLTQRLLAFSRRQTLDPKATDVNRLVRGMEDLFIRTLGPSIHLDTKLAAGLWLPSCDQNQLESSLLNLVINARDAMPDGGTLTITTANHVSRERRGAHRDVTTPNLPPGHYVGLFVTDTGVGMAPAVLERAFDPFFTTKPLGQGTGLGLSMTYGFVQQSGGQVLLESQEDAGTRVAIYLPRQYGLAAEDVVVSLADSLLPPTGSVILVVEDEPAMRMVLVDVLSDLNYVVLEAGSGRPGLNILDSDARVDLLLTDVGLPGGMNGRQLADAARLRRPDLKVLFITGYADGAAVGNGLMDLGMQVLIKPFQMHALTTKIQGMIAN